MTPQDAKIPLPYAVNYEAQAGEGLIIETPGGGRRKRASAEAGRSRSVLELELHLELLVHYQGRLELPPRLRALEPLEDRRPPLLE